MVDKNMLIDYMTRFRLECHYRLDMVPGDIKELPIFMYSGAQDSVRENMIKQYNLADEDLSIIDSVANFFLEKLEELDHYGKADDLVMSKIDNDSFIK